MPNGWEISIAGGIWVVFGWYADGTQGGTSAKQGGTSAKQGGTGVIARVVRTSRLHDGIENLCCLHHQLVRVDLGHINTYG